MTATGYYTSAQIAGAVGPFDEYAKNKEDMKTVLLNHYILTDPRDNDSIINRAAKAMWNEAMNAGDNNGYRNAQISLLAPTGTIGFMMDCDTTGIEPELALVRYKFLVGGGFMRLVNNTVPEALRKLGYNETSIENIVKHIVDFDTIEGSEIKDEHLSVFDCAFKPTNGTRSLKPEAHLKMMAAVQPFLSGAISKTVNMPNSATVQDIYDTYLSAWRNGLKAVAIYRDGCKGQQPVKTSKS
jgi:ribonucleoside-diphosphate reductase alpha chain